jgi:hypothetical protein
VVMGRRKDHCGVSSECWLVHDASGTSFLQIEVATLVELAGELEGGQGLVVGFGPG